jgi:hypothetical protein
MWLTGIDPLLCFLRSNMQTVAIVTGVIFGRHLLLAQLGQSLRSAETGIGMPRLNQLPDMLTINVCALTLPVRAARTADIRTLIPWYTNPLQRIEDSLFRSCCGAGLVCILDPEDKTTAVMFSKNIVKQCRIGGSNVGIAGG